MQLYLFLTFSGLVANPKKTTLQGGQSRSWSAEQGKNKIKKSGSAPPPPPLLPRCTAAGFGARSILAELTHLHPGYDHPANLGPTLSRHRRRRPYLARIFVRGPSKHIPSSREVHRIKLQEHARIHVMGKEKLVRIFGAANTPSPSPTPACARSTPASMVARDHQRCPHFIASDGSVARTEHISSHTRVTRGSTIYKRKGPNLRRTTS